MRPIAFLTGGAITGTGPSPLALLTGGMMLVPVIPVPVNPIYQSINAGGGKSYFAGKFGNGLHEHVDPDIMRQPDTWANEDDEMIAVIMRFMEVTQ